MNSKTIIQISTGVLLLVVAYFGATYFYKNGVAMQKPEDSETTLGATPNTSVPPTDTGVPMSADGQTPAFPAPVDVPPVPAIVEVHLFRDGTYSAEGTYTSPAGEDVIGVTLTVKDDIVTEVTVTPKAENPTSKKIQTNFASAVKELVVGKRLNTIFLDKVAGSSLTPQGFNAALRAIKEQAM